MTEEMNCQELRDLLGQSLQELKIIADDYKDIQNIKQIERNIEKVRNTLDYWTHQETWFVTWGTSDPIEIKTLMCPNKKYAKEHVEALLNGKTPFTETNILLIEVHRIRWFEDEITNMKIITKNIQQVEFQEGI
jgi:hypothetical protein